MDGITNTVRSLVGASPERDKKQSRTPKHDAAPKPAAPSVHTSQQVPSITEMIRSAKAATPKPTALATTVAPTYAAAPMSTANAYVYDASAATYIGTARTLAGSGSQAEVAATNVQRGLDYYARAFGRNGVDGVGSGVAVLINDRSRDAAGNERFTGDGGYFATPRANGTVTEAIHFGTGTSYQASRGLVDQTEMFHADDLAIHELTHGVIRKETGYIGGDANEAGASNEAIADVMAASATRDWRIGEGMYTARSAYTSMRNIAQPDDPTAVHGLWQTRAEVYSHATADHGPEEHWASGVISTAAARVQQRLGGELGWQAVEQVFYDTIRSQRLGDMSFAAVATALRTSAATLYGQGSVQAWAFDTELRAAGL